MIIHCEDEVLNNTVVMEFLQKDDMCIIPDNTAKAMAPYSKDWTGPDANKEVREMDPSELTREDQLYLYTAFELHHYWKSRIRALALTRSFEQEYDEVSAKLKQVVDVSESLRFSVSLINILGLILDLGNYMNDSNKQANGFKLSSLARLNMVKDEKNETTFADLIERAVREKYPEWEGFTDDIGGIIAAQKLNVDLLMQEAKRYVDNIKNVQMSLDSGNLSDPKKFHPQDRVSQVVQRCMKDARRKAEQMDLYLEEMVRTYDEIMAFYGEDPTDENARREFFSKIAMFVNEWKRSKEKNLALEAQRKRNEASIKRKNAQLQVNSLLADGSSAPPSPNSNGHMDALMERLRAAGPDTKDTRERRKRARLQNRHQVRVASGQKIPDAEEIPGVEASLRSPESVSTEGVLSPTISSKEDDIAERAALLLQGMRGTGNEEEEAERRDALRRARRRDNAEDERRSRRKRREKASGVSEALVEGEEEPAIEAPAEDTSSIISTAVVVSPPSPDGSKTKPIELDD